MFFSPLRGQPKIQCHPRWQPIQDLAEFVLVSVDDGFESMTAALVVKCADNQASSPAECIFLQLKYPQGLCNNAGIFHSTDWQKVQHINLDGMLTGTMLAMEKMGVRD